MSQRKCVLLVDDDASIVQYLSNKLVKHYDVRSTSDSRQVVAIARRELPDAILCDFDMPHLNGAEVAAALAQDSMLEAIPLIFLTDLVTPEEAKEMGGSLGGRPALSKRAPMQDLTTLIERLASRG
jgi:CheY-like chemotaxis protein